MNEVLTVIRNRRSIRLFKDEQIKKEELDQIIEAGLYAPSANNSQAWHFTVIQGKEMIERVNSWLLEEVEKGDNSRLKEIIARTGGKIFRNAPTVIIVSAASKDSYAAINAAAATQTILLAAESFGIGTCWIGTVRLLAESTKLEQYAQELKIPEEYAPKNGITLGYKAENPSLPERRQNLVSYIF